MNAGILSLLSWEDVLDIVYTYADSDEDATDKARAIRALKELREMYDCAAPVSERFAEVVAAAEQAVGCRLTRLRTKDTTLVRCFVSYRLREEGYTYSEIGRMLGRDHSTVTSQVNRVKDMLSLPQVFRWEVGAFRRFMELCG